VGPTIGNELFLFNFIDFVSPEYFSFDDDDDDDVSWYVVNGCELCDNRSDGRVTMQVTAPDTITSWVASAFAVSSDVGLGVAPSTARVSVHTLL